MDGWLLFSDKWTISLYIMIMVRRCYISMRWLPCPLCTRPTRLVVLILVLAHLNSGPRLDMSLQDAASGEGTTYTSGSPPVFIAVRVTRSLLLCMFCKSLFVLLSFFIWLVCYLSSIYGFWLPLWYLQIILANKLNLSKTTSQSPG